MLFLSILFWTILSICLVFIGYAIFAHTFLFLYLYIDLKLRTWRDPQTYAPIPTNTFLKNYCCELWYILGKIYLYPWRFADLTVHNNPSKYAVLLIHGYGRCQTDWLWLRKQLPKHMPVFLVNLKPAFSTIEKITIQSLPGVISNIRQQTGCEKVILIGHSMGGIVASFYKEFMDHQQEIAAVIAIGSAFHGTKIAILGLGENAREMCPGSEFLNSLRHKIQRQHQNYFQISTQFENLISPWESSVLPELAADHSLVLRTVPHLSMLHNAEVATQLNRWLDQISRGL